MKCTCGKCEIGKWDSGFIYYFSDVQLQRDRIISILASNGLMIQGTKAYFYVKIKLLQKICFNWNPV